MKSVTSDTLKEIRTRIGVNHHAQKRAKLNWDFVVGVADWFTPRVAQVIRGFDWAYKTGRFTATADMQLRDMNVWHFTAVLAEAIQDCKVMNDVPKWYNQR